MKAEILKKLKERRSDVIAYGGYLPGSPQIRIFDRLISRLERDELTKHDVDLIEIIINYQMEDEIPDSDIDLLDPDTGYYIN